MSVLKIFVTVVLTLVISLLIIGVMLPDRMHVERRITINAPQEKVVEVLSGFEHFNAWSPWAEYVPAAQYSYEGPKSGKGAVMRWKGNEQVGSGAQTILKIVNASLNSDAEGSEAATSVIQTKTEFRTTMIELKLDIEGWDSSTAIYKIDEQKKGTQVSWIMDSELGWNLMGRYFGFFMSDSVGRDYERGLGKLKTLLETQSAAPEAPASSETPAAEPAAPAAPESAS